MTNAISGMGTALLRNNVEIAEVVDISGPEITSDVIDVTHLKSPGFWREKIASLKDGGEITITVNLDLNNPTHNGTTGLLGALLTSGTVVTDMWSIVFPFTPAVTFRVPGMITGFTTGAATEDAITAEITITVAGQPVII